MNLTATINFLILILYFHLFTVTTKLIEHKYVMACPKTGRIKEKEFEASLELKYAFK